MLTHREIDPGYCQNQAEKCNYNTKILARFRRVIYLWWIKITAKTSEKKELSLAKAAMRSITGASCYDIWFIFVFASIQQTFLFETKPCYIQLQYSPYVYIFTRDFSGFDIMLLHLFLNQNNNMHICTFFYTFYINVYILPPNLVIYNSNIHHMCILYYFVYT